MPQYDPFAVAKSYLDRVNPSDPEADALSVPPDPDEPFVPTHVLVLRDALRLAEGEQAAADAARDILAA